MATSTVYCTFVVAPVIGMTSSWAVCRVAMMIMSSSKDELRRAKTVLHI